MAQDTTPAIIVYQGNSSNQTFSVPFDKGDYGAIKVAFVRRGLTDYEYNPTTYSVDGHLYAWALENTDPVQYYYTKDNDDRAYNASNKAIEGVTVDSMFDSSAVFSDGKTGYRARTKDIVSHALVEWLGEPLTEKDWICIVRETQNNQPYTYPNNQKHIEGALDNLSRQIQELKVQSEVSLKVDPTFKKDPSKMNPIDWLNTIVRSTDGTARGFRYKDSWLEFSTDDPNKAENAKTWTKLLNTTNVTTIREWYDEEKNEYRIQYSKDNGVSWKELPFNISSIPGLENRLVTIENEQVVLGAGVKGNADAIQKTREDYIQADSEIHQILNSHTENLSTLHNDVDDLGDQVAEIESKIPESASATNQLVTKEDLKSIDLEGYATTEYVNAREQEIRDDINQADSELQSQITAQASAITANTTSINGVKAVIPDGTSDTNPLINKQQLLDEEMDIRKDLNSGLSELQTQVTAQAAKIETKQDKLTAGDNIIISNNVISATGAGGGAGFDVIVVQELPAEGQKGIIYLLAKDGTAPDVYDEYVWITATQTFELIGSTKVDLSNYLPLSGGTLTGPLSFSAGSRTYSIVPQAYNELSVQFGDVKYFQMDTGRFMPSTNGTIILGSLYNRWKNVYTNKLNNGADIAVPTEGGTLARLEDLEGLGGLPDQTDNAGKFLTTDGTTASWSNKPLVNSSSKMYAIAVGANTTAGGNYSTALGINANASKQSSVAIGANSSTGNNAIAIGIRAKATGNNSIQLGGNSYAADTTNSDANTFKVGNANGNFEMMSADGTIPAERMSATAGTTGQVLTKTDAGMEWQEPSGGTTITLKEYDE